ncbi:hypothetical protein AMS68_006057 [Peltaster fructicola]|uniref:LSM complex subunit LSM4 n=1 Tax=Peltaster fructicola TaxID=286661 RepID=A0A6H0Y1K6_9PEZI|nr:hypothetical protein AMS68_006057 [Peltaster fructicola]
MLPLGLLTAAQGHPMLVELKNGETLNGHLVQCDTYMNLTLKEVVQTSPDGEKFFRLPECYVRGSNIKYLRVPDEIADTVKEQQQAQQSQRSGRGGSQQRGDHHGGAFDPSTGQARSHSLHLRLPHSSNRVRCSRIGFEAESETREGHTLNDDLQRAVTYN